MDNLDENKFLLINNQITIFDNIITELKDKIYKDIKYKKEICLYFRKLYNKENEKYDKMRIHIVYHKNIKTIKEFSFVIIIDDSFPQTSPIIYCDSLDININLNDERDLIDCITEKKWLIDQNINPSDILINLISKQIPEFVFRLLYYEENKILIYYGKYYLNEIYNINNFVKNKNIILFKVMTYKKDKDKDNYSELNMKYIIITDIYILFFDLIEGKQKNMAKLVFIGEIFQYNSIERLNVDINNNIINQNNNNHIHNNEENNSNSICVETQKIFIDWIINDKNYSFIFSLIKEINDNAKKNIIKENNDNKEILDFINIVNKKQNAISTKYKLVLNDFNQSLEDYNDTCLKNLIELAKYIEKSQNKKNNKNNENLKEKNIIKNEIIKIYNKIIDISTKINKIEITFDYLDKLQLLKNKKRTYNNNIYEENYNKKINKEKKNNDEKNQNHINYINNDYKINKNNNDIKNNYRINKGFKSNTVYIKGEIIKKEINKKNDIANNNNNINQNKKQNGKSTISSLIQMFENKKE